MFRRPTRRAFLGSAAATMATAAFGRAALPAQRVILINLVGGPSQIDTFDPKPDAPLEVRGPFRAISTSVPGLHFSEILPLTAARAHRLTVIRSVYHDEAPLHEIGMRMLQLDGGYLLPGPIGDCGAGLSHGQESARKVNGGWERARELIEAGARSVSINMFTRIYDTVSWDCHADGGRLATTLDDYRSTIGPLFDRKFAKLLDDLHDRGLLDSTLVVAAGEFGRTPFINSRGGRDHWPGCWSVLLAGGGMPGGAVVGSSDRYGGEPRDRPISLSELNEVIRRKI